MNKSYSLGLLLPCLLFPYGVLKAQESTLARDTTPMYHSERIQNTHNVLELKVNTELASNFLMRDFILEDYWTNAMIQDQVDRLKVLNSAGYEFSGELRLNDYTSKKFNDETTLTPFYGVGSKMFGGMRVNEGLIRVILEGNSNNRDISLNNGKNRTDLTHYTYAFYGLRKQTEDHVLSGSIGLALGHRLQRSRIRSGRVITQESGEQVDLENLDFVWEESNRNWNQGFGLITSWNYTQAINRGVFTIDISDLGLIRWTDLRTIKPRDEKVEFEGFDLSGYWDRDFSLNMRDSVDENYLTNGVSNSFRLTPFLVRVEAFQPMSAVSFYRVGVNYRMISGYIPKVSIGYGQYFRTNGTSRWLIGLDAGGFSAIGIRLESDIQLTETIGLRIKARGIESYAANLSSNWMVQAGLCLGL